MRHLWGADSSPQTFESKMTAHCVIELYETVAGENEPYLRFDSAPDVDFMSSNTIDQLWDMMKPFKIDEMVDKQKFLDALQQVGEKNELMNLTDEELDEVVPVIVVHQFLRPFVAAF